MEDEKQSAEYKNIEYGTQDSKDKHKIGDEPYVPTPGVINHFVIHVIGGYCHLRDISHEIG